MEQKAKYVSVVLLCLLAFAGGFGISYLFPQESGNSLDLGESGCLITSLDDYQEVHSIVVIDASTWGAYKVEVLINDIIIANYLPYHWNNMLEPVGEYNITVRIYGENENIVSEDSKVIVIPEEFIVPIDYEFTEDFVVHEGQTVTFADGSWELFDDHYSNGITPIDEKNYWSINIFGNLILDNATLKCKHFSAENDAYIDMTKSFIDVVEEHTDNYYDGDEIVDSERWRSIRLDDNAIIEFHSTYTQQSQYNQGKTYRYFVEYNGKTMVVIIQENASILYS